MFQDKYVFAQLTAFLNRTLFNNYVRKYDGKRDRVMGLPSHLDTSNLRLYCLNISHKILILGNGGIKQTQTYQEDVNLHRAVRNLQKIDIIIKKLENRRIITINGTNLHGPLELTIDIDNNNKEDLV